MSLAIARIGRVAGAALALEVIDHRDKTAARRGLEGLSERGAIPRAPPSPPVTKVPVFSTAVSPTGLTDAGLKTSPTLMASEPSAFSFPTSASTFTYA